MSEPTTRVFKILEYLAASDDWVSLRSMSRDLEIDAATAHRVLNAMKEMGYVQKHPIHSTYQLTLKIASISANVLERVQLRRIAGPMMEHLTSITNETTHLAILDGHEFVYINKVDNKQAVRMRSRVGQRGQLYCTAVGKAMLACLSDIDLQPILAGIDYQPLTRNTITGEKVLLEQLEQIRHQGWAIDDEENELGIRCIGSPIFDHAGRLAGALSISGWTITMTRERVARLASELIDASMAISRDLGYSGAK